MSRLKFFQLSLGKLWLFIGVIGLLCFSTYFLSLSQGRERGISAASEALPAVSSLQAKEIRKDLEERTMDLRLIVESMEIRRFFESESDEMAGEASSRVSDWLGIFLESEDTHIASLYDRAGQLLLRVHSANLHEESSEHHIHSHYLNASGVPDVLIVEDIRPINLDLLGDKLFFNLIAPVRSKEANSLPVGYLRLDFSVEKSILQWLKHPSGDIRQYETLLAKPIGEDLYFFSPLRKGEVIFARSIAEVKAEPAKQALKGENGFSDGLDYDGIPVFAWAEYIEELDASLVVKLDQEAVLVPFRQAALDRAGYVGVGGSLLVLFLTGFAARRERHYASKIIAAEQARAATAEQALLLKKAMDYATNLIYITDAEARLIYANSAVLKVSGYQMDELLGRSPSIFKSGVHPNKIYEDMWETITLGKPFFCEVTNRRKDGSLWNQEGVITPMLNEEGVITHYVAIYTDISERDELRDQLYHALDEAVEASRMKSEFMSRISHELRTPMNGIMGMVQLLGMTEVTDEQAKLLATVDKCSESMMEVVDDLLDLTINARRPVSQDTFDLQAALEVWIERWRHIASEKQLKPELICSKMLPERILANRDAFFKVLDRLISNAIKFSEKGSIVVRIEYDAEGTLRVYVEDEGRGVPEDYREHIFEPFSQAESAVTRSQGGMGLGLYLAKKTADSIGGQILYKNRASRGSQFCFQLSIVAAKPVAKSDAGQVFEPMNLANCKVLVAEDDPSNQFLIHRMLDTIGVSSIAVSNGQEVLDLMAKETFDLLLLDCHMPTMDGFETAKAIRGGQLKLHNPDLPIIAITADVDEACREQCIRVGMNDYIKKPLAMQQLESVILRILKPAHSIKAAAAAAES